MQSLLLECLKILTLIFDSLDFQAVVLSHNSVNSQLPRRMGLRNRSLKVFINYILRVSVTPKKTCKFLFILSLSKRKSSQLFYRAPLTL